VNTNSILFTGTPATCKSSKPSSKNLTPTLEGDGTAGPTTFIVYSPKYVPGDDLIQILSDFEQTLAASGITNRNLFDTIAILNTSRATCSLIISGESRVDCQSRRTPTPF
jgi:hypothetical protein